MWTEKPGAEREGREDDCGLAPPKDLHDLLGTNHGRPEMAVELFVADELGSFFGHYPRPWVVRRTTVLPRRFSPLKLQCKQKGFGMFGRHQ